MKKVIVLAVFILAVISLSSCRSTKNSCIKINAQEILQQDTVIACVEMK